MSPPTCTDCNRVLVADTLWRRYTTTERARLSRTHARYQGHGLCARDARRRQKVSGEKTRRGPQPGPDESPHSLDGLGRWVLVGQVQRWEATCDG